MLALSVVSPVQAQTIDPQLTAPITKFITSFNKGDMAGAAAAHMSDGDLVIIDEVPPFMWRGSDALKIWAGDLAADAKKAGITDQKVTLGLRRALKSMAPTPTSSCPPSTRSSKAACPSARART